MALRCGVSLCAGVYLSGAASMHLRPTTERRVRVHRSLLLPAERTALSDRRVYNLTYSYSNGRPLMPVFGLPSQFAILPGSVTGCISERT